MLKLSFSNDMFMFLNGNDEEDDENDKMIR